MAERTGLEPATPGVTGRYSNQLNYRSEFWGANPNGLIDKATSAFTPSTGQQGPHGAKTGAHLPSTDPPARRCVLWEHQDIKSPTGDGWRIPKYHQAQWYS